MKKTLSLAAIFAFTLFHSTQISAQNAIQFNFGFKQPLGNNISDAFKNSTGESISFMHQLRQSTWAIGGTLNQQKFHSNDHYFKDDFRATMSVSNALFSLRKKMFLQKEHYWYWGVDLGMALNKFSESKGGKKTSETNIGFTKGFALGSVWSISEKFAIDLNGTYHNILMDEFNYNDQFSKSRFKYASLNLGVRYEWASKK